MRRRVRSRAIIVNVETFSSSSGLKEREGSFFDVDNLRKLFEDLYFEVVQWKNNTTAKVCDLHTVHKKIYVGNIFGSVGVRM